MKRSALYLSLAVLICCFFSAQASAQELGYDPYTPVYYGEGLQPRSTAKSTAANFLTYPFEIIKWPVDKGLNLIEEYNVEKKIQWVYDTLVSNGVTPKFGISGLGHMGAGATFDWVRITRQKINFPDMVASTKIDWHKDINYTVRTKVGFERIGGAGLSAIGDFKYDLRPEEHFYGIGPDSSRGDGTSYKMETTSMGTTLGYNWGPAVSLEGFFRYEKVNISNGLDGGRGIVDETFAPQVIPGLDGDDMIKLGAELNHDTRDTSQNATQGGQERLAFSYVEGVNKSSEAQFFKYEAEISRYFKLGSKRRVLAVRALGEHNDEVNGGSVPFHQMAKLGGHGTMPRLSQTLRGYDFNRFFDESMLLFNLEYRYTVWEYRDFKTDALFFWDAGQVFREFTDFQFQDFESSYGLGIRFSVANIVLLSVELANGDEGTHFYVKSSAPF